MTVCLLQYTVYSKRQSLVTSLTTCLENHHGTKWSRLGMLTKGFSSHQEMIGQKKKNTNNKEINPCVWRKIDWTGVLTTNQQTVFGWSSEHDLVSLAKLIQRNMSLLELRFLPCPELDALLPSLETCRIEKKHSYRNTQY